MLANHAPILIKNARNDAVKKPKDYQQLEHAEEPMMNSRDIGDGIHDL